MDLSSPPTQPHIFFRALLPFQRAYIICRCSLNNKRTCHKGSFSVTERLFGLLLIEAAVLLLFFLYQIKNSDVRRISKTIC